MKAYLSLATVILAGLGVVGLLPAASSVTMFAAPGSSAKPELWVMFASVSSFPFVCLTAILLAWDSYRKSKPQLARLATMLPALNLFGFAVATLMAN